MEKIEGFTPRPWRWGKKDSLLLLGPERKGRSYPILGYPTNISISPKDKALIGAAPDLYARVQELEPGLKAMIELGKNIQSYFRDGIDVTLDALKGELPMDEVERRIDKHSKKHKALLISLKAALTAATSLLKEEK